MCSSLLGRIGAKEGGTKDNRGFLVIFFASVLIVEIANCQDFRIDNQLRILANDCYTRIAIGSRLPKISVISTTSGTTLADCESICSADRSRCNAFDYGVDSKGNGTCAIGRSAISTPEDLTIDPDFDVYERRASTPAGCRYDRLLKIGQESERTPSGGGRNQPTKTTTFGNFFATTNNATKTLNRTKGKASFFRGGWYSPIADDTDTRLYDILNDRKSLRALSHNTFDVSYQFPDAEHHDTRFQDDSRTDLCSNRAGFAETLPIFCKNFFPSPSPEIFYPFRQSFYGSIDFPDGFGSKIDSTSRKSKACYRKLLTGKRLSENHVRRSLPCDRIEECHRVCEHESTFVCEGFNYGRPKHQWNYERGENDGQPRRGYICQLTSVSGSRMNPQRDFVDDSRYDYYARDWTCPAGKVPRDPQEGDRRGTLPVGRQNNRPKWRTPTFPPSYLPRRPYETTFGRDTRYHYPADGSARSSYRPGDYDYLAGRDQPTWAPYLPQAPTYNQIHQHSRHPPARIPSPANEYDRRYYYRTRDEDQDRFPGRRMDDRGWRQEAPGPNDVIKRPPGFVYGGSYGYEKYPDKRPKDYPIRDNSYLPWEESIGEPARKRIPVDQDRHYDHVYGPAYGYDSRPANHDRSSWKPSSGPKWTGRGPGECSTRSLMGFKPSRKIVTASYAVGNLEECEMLCSGRTNDCLSFAYRYSLPTAPADNCLLSNLPFDKLDFYTDLEPERDYDIYAMIGDGMNCRGASKRSEMERNGSHGRSSEECFWRVASGYEMPPGLVRKEIRVGNGLGECQVACVSARHFTCRSFVFRYEYENDREANCFLSDCPTREIISAVDSRSGSFDPRRQTELYERGSYGRGCEARPFVPIYNSMNFADKPQLGGQGCYSGYGTGCKLSSYAVASVSRVDSENECRRQCSRMRHSQYSPPCMSFSFRMGDEKQGDNCYLSDVPRHDLRPGIDYTYDDDYVMYAWKELEPQCSALYDEGYDDPPRNDGTFNYASDGDDYRPQFTPSTGGFSPSSERPSIGLYTYNTLFLDSRPFDPDSSDFPRPPGPSTGTWSSYDQASNHGYSPSTYYPDGLTSLNLRYTVNGYPCKRGTKCEINKVAGFWSCEPEGSELGSWDYCCEPNHHCGFSQGYRYPWCYVGASEDQWRPCSEKYYPYLPSPRPTVGKIPDRNFPPPVKNPGPFFYRYHEKGRDTGDGCWGQGRHWPIAFLHPVPPPNTTDSVALAANDRRDTGDRYDDDKKSPSVNNDRATTANATAVVKDDRTIPGGNRSSETIDPPMTRSRTLKSHLKRRGLLLAGASANSTDADNREKKLRRLFIVKSNDKIGKVSPSVESQDRVDYRANKNNETGKMETGAAKDDSGLFVVGKNANSTVGREGKRYGRVERVTKANT